MQNERMAGIELMALYGDNDRLGAFLPGLRKGLRRAAKYTPHAAIARGVKKAGKKWFRFRGDDGRDYRIYGDEETLGAFLPGLKKFVKKVGKVTSGITTGVAKAVGVPQSAIDALAKIDPTKSKPSVVSAVQSLTPTKAVVAVPPESMKMDTTKILIIGGTTLGALVAIKILATPKARG